MMFAVTDSARALLGALVAGIDEALPAALALRTVLHSQPHLGGAESPTRDLLIDSLPWARPQPTAGTGMVVRVGPKGLAVGIRAELDALPIIEQTGVHWASANQNMHACGHDVHMAALWALLQAAQGLDRLPAGMVGLFQPREETQPSGALDIVREGVLERHEIGAVIGAHVQPRIAAGVVSTGVGGVNAAADEFSILVHGHGAHGAYPHVGIDPVPALAAIALGLHELVGRLIDPTHPAVITVGRIQAGTAPNVIPENGSIQGIIRTTDPEDRHRLQSAVRRLAEHTASARGAHAEVSIIEGDPVLSNDRGLVHAIDPLLVSSGLAVAAEPFRSCGADDFSHYGERVPIVMMFVGTARPGATAKGTTIGLHHAQFLPEESSVRRMAVTLAAGYVGAAGTLGRAAATRG